MNILKNILLFVIMGCFASCSSSSETEIVQEEEKCVKTCGANQVLNEEICTCEEVKCTLTCSSGFKLNEDKCECEEVPFVAAVIEVEVETATLVGDWKKKTDILGATGEGYIVWEGPDQFWKGADNIGKVGLLSFNIEITKPGVYLFQWYSYIAKKDPQKPTTEHNDSWLKIVAADDFYGKRNGGSIVYPKGSGKTPNPKGENGNGFFKVYMNTGDDWTWISSTSDNEAHQIYARFDTAKSYSIEIAPRSSYHAIDKFKLTQQKP